MFENDQEVVDSLLNESNDFKRLYDKHCVLKHNVKEAHEGHISVDDFSLEGLKKQKLMLKDRMSMMIQNYKHSHM